MGFYGTRNIKVKLKFNSAIHIRLFKDFREVSGKCGFNITQNGDQKLTYKKTWLIIRNRFSCQRYTVYKDDTWEISSSREYKIHPTQWQTQSERFL